MNASLENLLIWREFSSIGTEMIVTKTGRRLYPPFRVKVSGLLLNKRYSIVLEIVPCSDFRFKFSGGCWCVAGPSENGSQIICRNVHEDSPAYGSYWMSKVISFHKIKITNNNNDQQGHMILHSMHAYQLQLRIINHSAVCGEKEKTFHFPETKFIAVTAYQNDKVTRLKILNNPFAKGMKEKMFASSKKEFQSP